MRLRVGLIGLGDVWQMRHAPALRALADRFEVRAICDQVRHRAEQAAAEFDAEAVDGYHALVHREDIDAVLVLSPQWFGPLPILAACESGKAVYCAAGLDLDAERSRSRSSIAWRRRASPSWPSSPQSPGAGHDPAEGIDRHATGRAPAAVLSPAIGGRFAGQRPAWPLAAARRRFAHLLEQVDWCRYVVDRRADVRDGRGPSDRRWRWRRRLPDDEPRLFAARNAGHRPGRPDQLRPLHSPGLAGGHLLSPAGRAAGVVRARHRLRRSARHVGVVRRGGPASGVAGQRAADRRAASDASSTAR